MKEDTMPDPQDFTPGAHVEDRVGNRGHVTLTPYEGEAGWMVPVLWDDPLNPSARGQTVERTDNLTIVRD